MQYLDSNRFKRTWNLRPFELRNLKSLQTACRSVLFDKNMPKYTQWHFCGWSGRLHVEPQECATKEGPRLHLLMIGSMTWHVTKYAPHMHLFEALIGMCSLSLFLSLQDIEEWWRVRCQGIVRYQYLPIVDLSTEYHISHTYLIWNATNIINRCTEKSDLSSDLYTFGSVLLFFYGTLSCRVK